MQQENILKEIAVKIGDIVRTSKTNKTGKVIALSKNKRFIMIDLSDNKGIKFRWCHIENVEVANETR